MAPLTRLEAYEDEKGNRVEYTGDSDHAGTVSITFRGSGNVLRVGSRPRLGTLRAEFDCDNGEIEIGPGGGKLSLHVRVGQDSRIVIGKGATSTNPVQVFATEGATVTIGEDVMFASRNQVRADDGHPIFDIRTGKRVNPSRDITIGPHVWLAFGACVLSGAVIGEGSVVGMGTIVKGRVPNNVIVVGAPARVVKRDIAWERPHLSRTAPYYKPDASTVKKSKYWLLTTDSEEALVRARRRRSLLSRASRQIKRLRRR